MEMLNHRPLCGDSGSPESHSASLLSGRAEWCCGKSLGLGVKDWAPGPAVTYQLWALGCSNLTETVSSSVK